MSDKVHLHRIVREKKGHPHPLPPKAAFCPKCGEAVDTFEELVEFKCSVCEFIVEKNDKFCWQCGEELEDNGATVYFDDGRELLEQEFEKKKRDKVGKKAGMVVRKMMMQTPRHEEKDEP